MREPSRTLGGATGGYLILALSLLVAVAAPGVGFAQETAHQELAGEEHEASARHGEEDGEGHGEFHDHKNHIALFLGSTEAEEHHGEKGDPDFTIGLDYERRVSKVIGVGAMIDWVAEGNREFLVGIPVFFHVGRHARFEVAPAYHKLSEGGEDGFVLRTAFMWDFHVGGISLIPAIHYDFTEEQNFMVLGLYIGKGF